MKLAIVHCRIAPGWALNVLKDLIEKEKYNKAKIFTMYSTLPYLETSHWNIPITTVVPKFLHFIDHRFWMPLYPVIMKIISWKIKSYTPNKILISSFAIAKNINQCKKNIKTNIQTSLYLHSPMQYIRSHHNEYIHKLTWFKGRLFKTITPYLRKRDKKYTSYTQIYANSEYTRQEAKKVYNIESQVQYPEIDPAFLLCPIENQSNNYYVCVGRLVRFVREVDTIIKLFNQTQSYLLLIWSGPDEEYLKNIAWNSVIFLWQINDKKEIISIIQKSRWLINLTKESFGIGTAEALCLGVPVFGFNDGATPELVDKNSWILVENKTSHHLKEKFKTFENTYRDKHLIAETARKKFSH